MTTTRHYEFQCPSGDPERILRALVYQCDQHKWYWDPWVGPTKLKEADPGISFGFTVAARDQWWCHSRAMKLAMVVCEVLRLSPHSLPVPHWEASAPHHNRGYQYPRR